MLSSMSPSILERGGKPILVVGSPGGRTIINTVLEVIVNCIDHGLDVQAAVSAPRFHHQWLPDRIVAEAACLSEGVRKTLEALGHEVQVSSEPQGSAMAISILPGKGLEAGVDRRRPDTGAAGR
jgi:gamma-glutamyltranspeptidase/glutathione hydrolase